MVTEGDQGQAGSPQPAQAGGPAPLTAVPSGGGGGGPGGRGEAALRLEIQAVVDLPEDPHLGGWRGGSIT